MLAGAPSSGLDAVTNAQLYDRAWNQPTAKDWANVLASLPLFAGLTKRQLRRVAELARISEFEKGAGCDSSG